MRGMLVAVQRRDASMLRQAVLEVATLRRNFDDEQLERALVTLEGPSPPCSLATW